MKFRVNNKFADEIDELFRNGKLIVDDGFISREIARALAPLRKKGQLAVGLDRRLGKSILIVNNIKKTKRRKSVFHSLFEIF